MDSTQKILIALMSAILAGTAITCSLAYDDATKIKIDVSDTLAPQVNSSAPTEQEGGKNGTD